MEAPALWVSPLGPPELCLPLGVVSVGLIPGVAGVLGVFIYF